MTAEMVEVTEVDSDRYGEATHATVIGGDPSNPTWREYIGEINDEWRPVFVAIAQCVRKGPAWKGTADRWCNDYYFKTNTGYTVSFSWRAWGDFMQALVNKREGYMTYYM